MEERYTPNCPFEFRACARDSESKPSARIAHADKREAREGKLLGLDPKGREISIREFRLYAENALIVDCSEADFVAVAPPEWAKQW